VGATVEINLAGKLEFDLQDYIAARLKKTEVSATKKDVALLAHATMSALTKIN